jgi:hypothetical protein
VLLFKLIQGYLITNGLWQDAVTPPVSHYLRPDSTKLWQQPSMDRADLSREVHGARDQNRSTQDGRRDAAPEANGTCDRIP